MTIASNKTNSTPQVDDHAAHHNQIADVVNDHETRLGSVETALPTGGAVRSALVKKTSANRVTEWKPLREVPSPDEGDTGKFLKATSAGNWSWSNVDGPASKSLVPDPEGNGGKWLFNYKGTAQWKALNETLAAPTGGTAGDVLTANGSSSAPTWETPRYVTPTTGASAGDVLTYQGVTNAYVWQPPRYVKETTGAAVGDVLTYTGVANAPVWQAPRTAGTILGSTVSDAGKILAVNSAGDPVWAASPAGVDEYYYLGYSGTAPAYKRPPRTFQSTASPADTDGLNGDIWLKYTP